MQLYALDAQSRVVHVRQALRGSAYHCLECGRVVRLRGGPHRRQHFYHLDPSPSCRQHQKGPVHLHLQAYFQRQLPAHDCILECPFPDIGRIADVAWPSQKMVFEIQCSPISAEEVWARNQDYRRLGWSPVWILHDRRYNQARLSAAEIALRPCPHFFSDMNPLGLGVVYDQFDLCDRHIRLGRLPPLPLSFNTPPLELKGREQTYPLLELTQRAAHWSHAFPGDLLSLFWQTPEAHYLKMAAAQEAEFYAAPRPKWQSWMAQWWHRFLVMPYRVAFRLVLEKMCR